MLFGVNFEVNFAWGGSALRASPTVVQPRNRVAQTIGLSSKGEETRSGRRDLVETGSHRVTTTGVPIAAKSQRALASESFCLTQPALR